MTIFDDIPEEEPHDYIHGMCSILAAIETDQADSQPSVISTMGIIDSKPFIVLMDTGSTHNFVSPRVADLLQFKVLHSKPRPVVLASGAIRYTRGLRLNLDVKLPDASASMGAEVMDIGSYDLIVGMEFLTPAKAFIDCERRTVTFNSAEGKRVTITGKPSRPVMQCISMRQLCQAFKNN
jgi:hypothetical protein